MHRRIFVIADFKDDSPKSIRIEQRRWPKGFIRLGHDVQCFSYKGIMMQCSPFPGRRIAKYFGKKKADAILIEQIKRYHPDIIFTNLEYPDVEVLLMLREVVPDAVFIGRDVDPYPEKKPERIATAKQMDIVITTDAGRFIKVYRDAGAKRCAFIPCPCDPHIQHPYDVDEKWKSDIIFTGSSEHSKLPREDERYEIVRRLSRMPNARVYGCFGKPTVDGIETFYAISGAEIALSINIVNDVRLYHSDRLVNCLSCGTFTLAKRVPDSDLLFQDGVHLRYFDTVDEFFEIAGWYLKHDHEREKIAKAGMERAHSEFNCVKIAQYVLDMIETGTYNAPWAEIL